MFFIQENGSHSLAKREGEEVGYQGRKNQYFTVFDFSKKRGLIFFRYIIPSF